MYGEDDIAVQLMFYSTFEVLDLPGSGPMETCRVVKLYEPSPTPILYVGPVSNVLAPGASALDALVSPRILYADHPALFP